MVKVKQNDKEIISGRTDTLRVMKEEKMKKFFLLVLISSIWLLLAYAPGKGEQGALRPDIHFGKIPLYFVANKGQVNEKARFYAKASRYTLWMTKQGLVFEAHSAESRAHSKKRKTVRDVSRLLFLDANRDPEMVPIKEAKLRVNYFKGKDKSKWHCDIPTSLAVLYKSLYKNIDLKVYGIEKVIEYDWIVKPGGNHHDIRFVYTSVKGTRLDEQGNLLIETDFGELMHKRPVSYQKRKAQSAERRAKSAKSIGQDAKTSPQRSRLCAMRYALCDKIDVKFKRISNNTYGFEVGEYDKSRELIIDPVVLAYSTYLGGSSINNGYGIAVDGSGCAYVTGRTKSSDFPTMNQYQVYQGDWEAFMTKLDTTKSGASSLIYSTYLGGSNNDYGSGIAVDSSGCAYAAGSTDSSDFPTRNPYQANLNGYRDTFLTKLDTTKNGTSSLIYSTYLGGSGNDDGRGIAVDDSGCAYVTGSAVSSDFPTLNPFQAEKRRLSDAFITKLDTTISGTSSLIYSTYLGGYGTDEGRGIAVDSSGCAYVTGSSISLDFPILNPYQGQNRGVCDASITKLDTTKSGTSSLIYSTYLGGSNDDYGYGIAVDHSGRVYVAGVTWSSNFPTLNEYQAEMRGRFYDAFVTKLVLRTGTPSIQLNRGSFYFGAVSGGPQTGSQTLSVDISGGYNVHWTASYEETWIQVTPTSATDSALAAVSVDTGGLTAGTYTGSVSIACASASNSPQDVTVNLTIYDAASTSVPFGLYATPVDNSVVSGSVPFTGWVLDDVGVDSVKLYRRDNGSPVYIGDAVLVEGARPDVEQAYPNYPFNYRAGWGYMMLTHFLPNNGNGTFAIEAIATDIEGQQVSLGTRTVVVDNANAVKPFGAMDTPAQGGTASGSDYRNSGWVLTPLPNTVPTDGSTIDVYIDGVFLGNPVYNVYRPDIASLFPGYNNSDGAHAYVDFDTTAYENGIHTIYWTAEDDAGNADGIGSRYFSIQNSQDARSPRRGTYIKEHGKTKTEDPGLLSEIPVDYFNPVTVKKGWGRNIEPQKIYPDHNGIITIETRELQRVVIHLDGDGTHSTDTDSYIYLTTGGRLRPLPIGSTFDAERDIFYWQPGPGFIYQYNFVFIKKRVAPAAQEGKWQKKIIRVVINPGL
jgi:hypothetical protein